MNDFILGDKIISYTQDYFEKKYREFKDKLLTGEVRYYKNFEIKETEFIKGIDRVYEKYKDKLLIKASTQTMGRIKKIRDITKIPSEEEFYRTKLNRLDPPGYIYLSYADGKNRKIDKKYLSGKSKIDLIHYTCFKETRCKINDIYCYGEFEFKDVTEDMYLLDLTKCDFINESDAVKNMENSFHNAKKNSIEQMWENMMKSDDFKNFDWGEAIYKASVDVEKTFLDNSYEAMLIFKFLSSTLFVKVDDDKYLEKRSEYYGNFAVVNYILQKKEDIIGVIYKSTRVEDKNYSKNIVIFDSRYLKLKKNSLKTYKVTKNNKIKLLKHEK